VVGAPDSDASVGKAYVFVKPSGGWMNMPQSAKLTSTDNPSQSYFGCSVAVSGDTIVVGAKGTIVSGHLYQGSAYVFVKPRTGWTDMTETDKLTASDGVIYDNFVISVAISDNTVVVGAVYGGTPDTGTAYVFLRGSGWSGTQTENVKMTASDAVDGDGFGQSVAISGDTIVVGAPSDNTRQGSSFVFRQIAGLHYIYLPLLTK
jgi:FG-GAP repeat